MVIFGGDTMSRPLSLLCGRSAFSTWGLLSAMIGDLLSMKGVVVNG